MGDDYYIGWQADRGAAAAGTVASSPTPPHCAQGGRIILGEKFFLTATGFADRRFPPPWLSALVLSLGSKGHVTALLHGPRHRRRCRRRRNARSWFTSRTWLRSLLSSSSSGLSLCSEAVCLPGKSKWLHDSKRKDSLKRRRRWWRRRRSISRR